MPQVDTTVAPTAGTVKVEIRAGKFNGHLAAIQQHAFWMLKMAGFNEQVAHKIATDVGSDFGRLMASNPDIAAKVAKAKKDGDCKVAFSIKGSVKSTVSLATVRVCNVIDGLYNEGLVKDRTIPALDSNLAGYVSDCEAWARTQQWATA